MPIPTSMIDAAASVPFWRDTAGKAELWQGDVRECLRRLPAGSVHCVVTSPPYWGLRDYRQRNHRLRDAGAGAVSLGHRPFGGLPAQVRYAGAESRFFREQNARLNARLAAKQRIK